MSKSQELRIAVVGAGRGRCYASAAAAQGGVRLAAVCDRRPEALAPWRGADVAAFTDYDALLRDERVDAVVLATPAPARSAARPGGVALRNRPRARARTASSPGRRARSPRRRWRSCCRARRGWRRRPTIPAR